MSAETDVQADKAWCHDWVRQSRDAVPNFISVSFGLPGAWRLNRAAFGWDLLRAPCNIFWAPVWIVAQLTVWVLNRLGAQSAANLLASLPPGLATAVQMKIQQQIQAQIIGPMDQFDSRSRTIVERALDRYIIARQATAEITANLGILLIGWLVFASFTPGGFGLGQLLADQATLGAAVDGFWLGSTLGSYWYGWFPPQTPWWATLIGIIVGLCLLSFIGAFSGLLSDPLQKWLGIHQRRLRRMLRSIEIDVRRSSDRGFRVSEPYWARLLDGIDLIKLGL